jgi:hypothetical protein
MKADQNTWKRKGVLVVASLATLGLSTLVISKYFFPPLYLTYKIHQLSTDKERQLLYKLNPDLVASEVRKFGDANGWKGAHQGLGFEYFVQNDPQVPEVLRALNPTIIRVFPERIDLDFGGAFLSFGLSIFRDRIDGGGTKRLGNGIWFYADDGRVPAP